MVETSEVTGLVVVTLIDKNGNIKSQQAVKNLITDAGDQYHVTRIASAVVPLAPADATKVTGMKLGTGTTAASKAGAGAALVTYLTGTNVAFDTGFPTTQNLGSGLGWTVTYQTTFVAGVGTHAALTEVVLVNDAASNATSTAANTIARVVFTATPKGATDTLAIAWAHKQLGS
jgi:hypothetical protein